MKLFSKIKNYFNAKDVEDKYKDMSIYEKCKRLEYDSHIENIKTGRVLMCVHCALLVFIIIIAMVAFIFELTGAEPISVSAHEEITAFAAAPSDNQIYIYPGSESLLPSNYDYLNEGILYEGGSYYEVIVPIDLSLEDIESNPSNLYQAIFYIENIYGEFYYLDGIGYENSTYLIASDHGYGDQYFVYYCDLYRGSYFDDDVVMFYFHQPIDDYYGWFENIVTIYVYDLRLVEPGSSGGSDSTGNTLSVLSTSFFDGIMFTTDVISDSVVQAFDSVFISNGEPTVYMVASVWFCGIGIMLGFIKWLLSYLLHLGDKRKR